MRLPRFHPAAMVLGRNHSLSAAEVKTEGVLAPGGIFRI
jgi:hypothetical protein